MKEIDKTKKNLRVEDIPDLQRKDLFKKFQDAGGKVVSEKQLRRNLVIDREKQKQYQKKLDSHYNNIRIPSNKQTSNKKEIILPANYSSTLFDRFIIRWRLWTLGISGFSSLTFKNAFFKKFNDDYKSALIELQMIFLAIFKKDPSTGNRIIRNLDKISPIYYELAERSGDLFDMYLIDQILEGYKSFPDVPQNLSELRESITALFRMLFLLKPFENSIYNAYEKSIDMSISYSEGKKDKNINKRDLKNSLFVIFNKLYPRLHTLFCHYHKYLFNETDRMIEELLSILQAEKPGNRVRRDRTANIQTVADEFKLQESEQSQQTLNIADPVKEGLKLMYSLDNSTLRNRYDKKGEFEHLNNTDKVLLSFLLFQEFEKEYSFILTTNKIKYNIDFSTSVKVDYREKMQDHFNQLNKCRESFLSYYEVCLEHDKIFNQKPINNNQYIAYSKRLDEIVKTKKQAGSISRATIKTYMDRLIVLLEALIEDMNGMQRYISNPQDIIELIYEIEGEKKLNNKKIFEAIEITYNYISALSYRLSPDGDLSGKLEFTEDEQNVERDNRDLEEKKESRSESIFDELEDII